jgi:hypothetical protein
LHLDGSPHVIRTTITLWHFDAGSGRRPPHHNRPSRHLSTAREIGVTFNQELPNGTCRGLVKLKAAGMPSAGKAF